MKDWIKETGIGIMISGICFFALFGPNMMKNPEPNIPYTEFSAEVKVVREYPDSSSCIGMATEIPHVAEMEVEVLKAAPIEVPGYIVEITERVGEQYDICPELLQAIAWRESRFDADAVNASGTCFGLMQVSEKWHSHRMNDGENLLDPETNIRVATEYLSELFERYEDPAIVLMIYNGDSRWSKSNYISGYAEDILSLSAELEDFHGK